MTRVFPPDAGESSPAFLCAHCHNTVPGSAPGTVHRNHCPHCLWSLHVDLKTGDRRSACRGPMEPVAVGIQANARGSGVGSIVSFALHLSHVCPLEFDLLFERFLDENRLEAARERGITVWEQENTGAVTLAVHPDRIEASCFLDPTLRLTLPVSASAGAAAGWTSPASSTGPRNP